MNIKELWDKADQLQQEGEGKLKEADGVRWSVARELHVRNGTGESGHTLSTLTGRDRRTIQCYITAWREYGDTDLVFQEAFDLARVARAKREEVRKEAEETNTTVRSTIDRNQKKTGGRTAAKAKQTEDQKKNTEEAVKKATESVKSNPTNTEDSKQEQEDVEEYPVTAYLELTKEVAGAIEYMRKMHDTFQTKLKLLEDDIKRSHFTRPLEEVGRINKAIMDLVAGRIDVDRELEDMRNES